MSSLPISNGKHFLDNNDIKEVVKTIQSNEYELAKKNEQIKNDIDSKISSETDRLAEIILNLEKKFTI